MEKIDNLTKYETEQLLKALNNPPVELTKKESESLQSIEARLTSHIDQISIDDILDRVEKLPMEMQRKLIQLLSERLSA